MLCYCVCMYDLCVSCCVSKTFCRVIVHVCCIQATKRQRRKSKTCLIKGAVWRIEWPLAVRFRLQWTETLLIPIVIGLHCLKHTNEYRRSIFVIFHFNIKESERARGERENEIFLYQFSQG